MKHREPVNILLVDDQPGKLLSYEVILEGLGEKLIKANSAREAFTHLLKSDVAVILVDVCMPELDGFQLVKMLREHPRFEKTAVIFVSAIQQTEIDLLRGYETGAVDFVQVPVVPEILRAKVRVLADLHRNARQLENINTELERRVAERTSELQSSTALLRESEERLRLASEAAGFGTYDYNLRTDRFHCSAQHKRLLGTDIEGPLSLESFVALCHPEDRAALRRCLSSSIDTDRQGHEIEFRVVRADGTIRWLQDRGASFTLSAKESEGPSRIMGTIIDVTDTKSAVEQQELLMADLDHRVKNILGNVAAMLRLSARRASTIEGLVEAVDGRIQAMSQAHELLGKGQGGGADLNDLVTSLLGPFRSESGVNIVIKGEPLCLAPKVVQTLGLVLYELVTNAAKHGALSFEGGCVHVEWSPVAGTDEHCLRWHERGGPAAQEPERAGFGLTVFETITAEIGSHVERSFNEEGFKCSITGRFALSERAPKSATQEAVAPEAAAAPQTRSTSQGGRSILVVEDEALVAYQLKAELESDGYIVVGPAHSVERGVALAKEAAIDAALIDVRLGQATSAAIADQLVARKIPFAFSTGYSDVPPMPENVRHAPTIKKPYRRHEVRQMLERLINSSPALSANQAKASEDEASFKAA